MGAACLLQTKIMVAARLPIGGLCPLPKKQRCIINNQQQLQMGFLKVLPKSSFTRTLCTFNANPPPLKPLDRKIIKATSDDDVPPAAKEENSSEPVKWVVDFNKKFGYIEKFNKILKSFEVYPILGKLGIWIISMILGSFEKNKQHYGKLKTVAAKYSAYTSAFAIVVLAVAASIWIKKMQSKNPPKQDPEENSNSEKSAV